MVIIRAALVAACLCAPVVARADPDPPCEDLAQSRAEAQVIAEKGGLGLVNLDGAQARLFLDYVNAQGDPTSFMSDHIGVFIIPSRGVATVVLADSPCGGYKTAIHIQLKMYLDAYRAATGTKV